MNAVIWDGRDAVVPYDVGNALRFSRGISTSVAHVVPWPVETVGVGGFSVDVISQITL